MKSEIQEPNVPVIVCGDFNSVPNSSVFSLISDQKEFVSNKWANKEVKQAYAQVWEEYTKNKQMNNIKGQLKSAYQHYRKVENKEDYDELRLRMKMHPGFTNFTSFFHGTLDYIFHTDQ